MIRKLFSIVVSHGSDALCQRSKACNDGLADQVRGFASDKPRSRSRLPSGGIDCVFQQKQYVRQWGAYQLSARDESFRWRSACAFFTGNEVISKAYRLEPYQRIRVGRSFHGSLATKLQSAQDSNIDYAARRVASMDQFAERYDSFGLVADKGFQPVGVVTLSSQSCAEPLD